MWRLIVAITMAGCFALLVADTAEAGIIRGYTGDRSESWYTYWGLGWSNNSYPHEVEKFIDSAKSTGADGVSICIDMLGFYWPIPKSPNTLVGFVINGAADRYSKGNDYVQVSSYLMGLSSMHFFGVEPGAGFFIRADLGMAFYNISGSDISSENSGMGYGGLLGGGYGIAITEGTRILFNVNYALRQAEGDNVGSLGISIGGLF